MESEKVKEIKKALEYNILSEFMNRLPYADEFNKLKMVSFEDILTLINELERDVLVGKKIAERPKIKESIVAPIYVLPNVESPEIMLKLGEKNLVYQFAERLKEKLKEKVNADNVDVFVECAKLSDETLKEFINERKI